MDIGILLATPAARSWLRTSSEGAVLHVFSASCNLVNKDESVLSLIMQAENMGPFSMLVSEVDERKAEFRFDSWVDADSLVRITDSELRVGPVRFVYNDTPTWNPAFAWHEIQPSDLLEALPQIEAALAPAAPDGSLFEILNIDELSGTQEAAKRAWNVLKNGLQERNMSFVVDGVHRLSGLGQGLTPAGDDFLVGVLHSMMIMADSSDRPLIRTIAAESRPRTTRLSAAWLDAAGNGEAGMMWHRFLGAIRIRNERNIVSLTRLIAAVGHTSGADALAGFIAASRYYREQNRVR